MPERRRVLRSEIVPPQGEGHAAWTATASHQLAAFDRNYRALVIGDRLITCQQLHGRDEPKAGVGQLVERGVVAVVAQDDAWAYREAIAGRSPLFAFLDRPLIPATEDRFERVIDGLHRREEVGHFFHTLGPFATMQHRQPFRPNEMRRKDDAEVFIDLGEDHVEMDRGPLRGEHDDDHVRHRAVRKDELAQQVERRRAGALAEAEDDEVGADGVYVAALERVIEPFLIRAVIQDPCVFELPVVPEQRFDEQLFGPANAVPHRADDGVLADHYADVARTEQIGQRWQRIGHFVEGPSDGATLFQGTLHHERDKIFR